jgi:hypothetical protein
VVYVITKSDNYEVFSYCLYSYIAECIRFSNISVAP